MREFDNIAVSQRVQQWDLEQGGDALLIDHYYVFSNGAMRERNPCGAWMLPPADLYKRSKIQLKYHEELLREAAAKFLDLKNNLEAVCRVRARQGDPPLAETDIARLKDLQSLVKQRQKAVEVARSVVDQHTPKEDKQRAEAHIKNIEDNENTLEILEKITI